MPDLKTFQKRKEHCACDLSTTRSLTFRLDVIQLTRPRPISPLRSSLATKHRLWLCLLILFLSSITVSVNFKQKNLDWAADRPEPISFLQKQWRSKPLGFCSFILQKALYCGESSCRFLYKADRSFELR